MHAGAAAAFRILHQQHEALGAGRRRCVQDNCGDTFSPTQFGLFGALAVLLATFFGIIVPSLKVVEVKREHIGAHRPPRAAEAPARVPLQRSLS